MFLLVPQEEMSSGGRRRQLFLWHRTIFLLVSQEETYSCDMSMMFLVSQESSPSCETRSNFFLWRKNRFPPVSQEVSSCDTRLTSCGTQLMFFLFACHQKNFFLWHENTYSCDTGIFVFLCHKKIALVIQEDMSSCRTKEMTLRPPTAVAHRPPSPNPTKI